MDTERDGDSKRPEAGAAFLALGHRSLARAGLDGAGVDVALGPGSLVLAGGRSGRIEIPFEAIDRVRFGYDTSRLGGRIYDMRVWTHRARRPLFLRKAGRDGGEGYAELARRLAAAVAERRGVACVESGLGWGGALGRFLPVLPFVGYGAWASVEGFRRHFPLPFLVVLPACVFVVGGMLGYAFLRLWRPRRLSRLEQLEPYVAPGAHVRLF